MTPDIHEALQDVKEFAEERNRTTLLPATNLLIVKEATEDPIVKRYIQSTEKSFSDVRVTWTGNTAEIRV